MAKQKELKVYTVFLDGIDKTGKDTIRQYVWRLNKALNVFCRGYISLEAYNRKFNRNVRYRLPYRNALYVLLTVDKADWQIRCEVSDEPEINYEHDSELFNQVFKSLDRRGYYTIEYNTSKLTAFEIAQDIVKTIEQLNS